MKKILNQNKSLICGLVIISFLLLILFCPFIKFRIGDDNLSTTTYISGIDAIMGGEVSALKIFRSYTVNEGTITHTLERSYASLTLKSNLWLMIIVGVIFLFGSALIFSRFKEIKRSFMAEAFKILIIITYSFFFFKTFRQLENYSFIALLLGLVVYAFTYIKSEEEVFFSIGCLIVASSLFFASALHNYVNGTLNYVLAKELIVFITLLVVTTSVMSAFEIKNNYLNKAIENK